MDLKLKIIPRSNVTAFAGTMDDGTLKVKVKAVPEDGKANRELIVFLARHYGVPQDAVEIVTGAASQRKLVRIRT